MNTPAKPELEQLVDTFRAITEEDVTEPLLPEMRTLTGMIDRKCSTETSGITDPPTADAHRPQA